MDGHNVDLRPNPDPSVLTTAQLLREIENAITLLESRMDGLRDVREAQIEAIRGEFGVRFGNIKDQFQTIEEWRKEQKLYT